MPTKSQIQSVSKALRKSVERWNKVKFKFDKAEDAYQKGRKKIIKSGKKTTTARKLLVLKSLTNRWNKAKMEFLTAQDNYVKTQRRFKEVMGRG